MACEASVVSTPATARALRIPYIVTEIFQFLAPFESQDIDIEDYSEENWRFSKQRQHSLLQLACVCRAFVDPALDVLYHTMCSLRALLDILPSFRHGSQTAPFVSDTVNVLGRALNISSYGPSPEGSRMHNGLAFKTTLDVFESWSSQAHCNPSSYHASLGTF